MLRGSVEHYEQPDYYDRAYASRDDVAFYVAAAKRSRGPVLEYGVGSGRVALPIAAAGVEVVGVDRSGPMLGALRRRLSANPELRARLSVVRGDMRRKRFQRQFRLVIAPFNTVLHLYERRDIEQFFERVHEHLAPGGRFIFDFSVPRAADLSVDPERWFGGPKVRHPELGETVRYAERFHYSPMTQVLSTWMRFTGRTEAASRETLLTHRQFFPREMEALLHYNGFADSQWSGGFDGAAPGPISDTLVVSCRSGRPAASARRQTA